VLGRSIHNYVVKQKIGEGGMGAVYLAEHPKIGRRVAIKVLLPQLSKDPQLLSRFFNEARAATEIHNEHIVDIIDFGELDDGGSYIIMEWLEGRSLTDALAQDGRFALPRAVHVARGIARALAAAHARGIVHRDLKPDNIYLVRHGDDPDFAKVLDFGIAKLMLNQSDFKTQTGAIMGTPYYMSPEQCNGAAVDQRTDIYALGVILFQMMTGRLPFQQQTLGELLVAHLTQAPPKPTQFEPTMPIAVENAILQALEKDPAKRFASVDALLKSFADVPTGQMPVAAQPLGDRYTPPPVKLAQGREALTVPPPNRQAPIAAPRTIAKTAAEVFVRVGIRGKRAQQIVAGVGAALVLLVILLIVRKPAPPPMVMTPAGPAVIPAPVAAADDQSLLDELRTGESCSDRRDAARALIAKGDRRYLEALRAARDRQKKMPWPPYLAVGPYNDCMHKELKAAIKKLEGL
jgi:serine/threonine-protein kinase